MDNILWICLLKAASNIPDIVYSFVSFASFPPLPTQAYLFTTFFCPCLLSSYNFFILSLRLLLPITELCIFFGICCNNFRDSDIITTFGLAATVFFGTSATRAHGFGFLATGSFFTVTPFCPESHSDLYFVEASPDSEMSFTATCLGISSEFSHGSLLSSGSCRGYRITLLLVAAVAFLDSLDSGLSLACEILPGTESRLALYSAYE